VTEPALRFLALGDSYTIGEAVTEAERWPVLLARLLRAEGIPLEDPEIVATTGWTTDELAAGIDTAAPRGPYALVSLLIGVNNQYRGRDLEEYGSEFGALLERAVGFAAGRPERVLVLSIPDWGVTPFADGRDRAAIATDIDRFNDENRARALRRGARYVDVTPISRTAAERPELNASDGLHPAGEMYTQWAGLALPVARLALSTDSAAPAPPAGA
jgi:lysophospholipase L1-like esterase